MTYILGVFMINVGIVGYGNLGHAVEEELLKKTDFNLVGIFSNQNLDSVISPKELEKYKDKIDLLFLCVGSYNNVEKTASKLAKDFSFIDAYDNHANLKKYISNLDDLAYRNNNVVISACGWDPGLFSYMRGLFDSLGYSPYTFWGKGTSQGHTQAIKTIDGVVDAIQFTIPNDEIVENIKNGFDEKPGKRFHKRDCFVVCNDFDKDRIEFEIKNMPDYFLGYETTVHFVTQKQLDLMKSYSHKGQVLTKNNTMNFSLDLKSNPNFTAKVMIAYSKTIKKLKNEGKFGAYSIMDIPLKSILNKNEFEYL